MQSRREHSAVCVKRISNARAKKRSYAPAFTAATERMSYNFVKPCSLIDKSIMRGHIFRGLIKCPKCFTAQSNPEHSIRLHIESSSLYSVSLPAKLCSFSVLHSKVGAIASRNISNYITCDGFTFHPQLHATLSLNIT